MPNGKLQLPNHKPQLPNDKPQLKFLNAQLKFLNARLKFYRKQLNRATVVFTTTCETVRSLQGWLALALILKEKIYNGKLSRPLQHAFFTIA